MNERIDDHWYPCSLLCYQLVMREAVLQYPNGQKDDSNESDSSEIEYNEFDDLDALIS